MSAASSQWQHRRSGRGADVQNSGRAAQTSCDGEARGDLGGLDSRDANRTTSPATAGDGDFDPGPDPW